VAITAYAADNNNFFPDNSGGRDLSWMGPELNEFYRAYLYPNHRGTTTSERVLNDVLYCPTDEWHRYAETGITSDNDPQLIGYFSLPARQNNSVNFWDYTGGGIAEWHFRKKLGGPYRNAPTMSDRLQGLGSWNSGANNGNLTWSWVPPGVPTANHRDRGGVPTGGNFLFEDGHVEWRKFNLNNARDTVDMGSMYYGWTMFYKLPNVQTNL
jgi:hypothetical protein